MCICCHRAGSCRPRCCLAMVTRVYAQRRRTIRSGFPADDGLAAPPNHGVCWGGHGGHALFQAKLSTTYESLWSRIGNPTPFSQAWPWPHDPLFRIRICQVGVFRSVHVQQYLAHGIRNDPPLLYKNLCRIKRLTASCGAPATRESCPLLLLLGAPGQESSFFSAPGAFTACTPLSE